jgi:hypothetical protein
MWRLFFAFLAAAALLYGGLHLLGRRDRSMAARRAATPAVVAPATAVVPHHPGAVVEN